MPSSAWPTSADRMHELHGQDQREAELAAGEEAVGIEQREIVLQPDELRIERGAPEQRAVGEGNEDHPEERHDDEGADEQRPPAPGKRRRRGVESSENCLHARRPLPSTAGMRSRAMWKHHPDHRTVPRAKGGSSLCRDGTGEAAHPAPARTPDAGRRYSLLTVFSSPTISMTAALYCAIASSGDELARDHAFGHALDLRRDLVVVRVVRPRRGHRQQRLARSRSGTALFGIGTSSRMRMRRLEALERVELLLAVHEGQQRPGFLPARRCCGLMTKPVPPEIGDEILAAEALARAPRPASSSRSLRRRGRRRPNSAPGRRHRVGRTSRPRPASRSCRRGSWRRCGCGRPPGAGRAGRRVARRHRWSCRG